MASPPAAPPQLPPPPVWNCGGIVGIDMPTVWWSQEDEGLAITVCINLAVSAGSLLAFVLLSRVPTLAATIYAPLAVSGSATRPVPWAPRTWLHMFRKGGHAEQLRNADGGSLDRTMLLRYLRMNLRLFGSFGLLALPVMLPLNAQTWDDGTEPLQPPDPEAKQVEPRHHALHIPYGCSLHHIRLQPPSHTVAASGTYGRRRGAASRASRSRTSRPARRASSPPRSTCSCSQRSSCVSCGPSGAPT
jgi:hypothetical protein